MQPIDQETINMASSTANPDQAERVATELRAAGYTITAAQIVALANVHNVCFYLFDGTEEVIEAVYQICRAALDLPPAPTKYQRLLAARSALAEAGYTVERYQGWLIVRQAERYATTLDDIDQLEQFVSEHQNDPPRTRRGFLKPPPEV